MHFPCCLHICTDFACTSRHHGIKGADLVAFPRAVLNLQLQNPTVQHLLHPSLLASVLPRRPWKSHPSSLWHLPEPLTCDSTWSENGKWLCSRKKRRAVQMFRCPWMGKLRKSFKSARDLKEAGQTHFYSTTTVQLLHQVLGRLSSTEDVRGRCRI